MEYGFLLPLPPARGAYAPEGIHAKVLSHMRVAEHLEEGFHVGKLLDIPEEFYQEDTYGVICKADQAVPMGEDGADKGLRLVEASLRLGE